ncbi:MAG: XRE family transcriptional regulator [Phycisphaerales bacterium]|nr:XRE family transcriptional regulator [Phycisphaerales bacterium]
MLVIARDAKRMTQEDVANALGVSQALVSKWDNGIAVPPDDTAQGLAKLLGVRPAFFEVECGRTPALLSEFYHRSLTSAPRSEVKAAHARCRIYDIQIGRLLDMGEIPTDRIPALTVTDTDRNTGTFLRRMEDAASKVRSDLGIQRGPIENLTTAIESGGGIVIDQDLEVDELDALCRWIPGLPKVFFVNGRKPADRVRFSLAHELGHTVLHFGTQTPQRAAEDEAQAFASAFLMPASDFAHDVRSDLRLSDLAQLKRKWRVSMQAIAHRAHDLGLITKTRFQSIYVDFSRKKWRKEEPVIVAGETPTAFRYLVKQALSKGLSVGELSEILFVGEDRIEELVRDLESPTWESSGVRLRLARS